MKQNYITPIAEAIELRLENDLLVGSGWNSSSSGDRPSDCPCKRCPYGK